MTTAIAEGNLKVEAMFSMPVSGPALTVSGRTFQASRIIYLTKYSLGQYSNLVKSVTLRGKDEHNTPAVVEIFHGEYMDASDSTSGNWLPDVPKQWPSPPGGWDHEVVESWKRHSKESSND